jgi:hypothetical protein
MSNVADENRAFLKIRSDREAQQAHRELIAVLEKFPADQRESVITKALEELADSERRQRLLDLAREMSTEELARRLGQPERPSP